MIEGLRFETKSMKLGKNDEYEIQTALQARKDNIE